MTIYDIAKEAGVSASTVSRIINKRGGVSEATKKRIEALLEKYHYCPNEAARGLVNQASKIIGILIMDIRLAHHTDDVYYIEREFEKLDYCCIIMNTGKDDEAKARYIRILSQRRVEGAVLIGSGFQCNAVKKAIAEYLSEIPVVISNGQLDLPNVYGVLAEDRNGIARVVEMLAGRGRRHIAFIDDGTTPSGLLKQEGYQSAVYQYCKGSKPQIVYSESSLEGAYQATLSLLEKCPETDAIIYAGDSLAVGGIRALEKKKINIPKQIAVVAVGNSLYAKICEPKLTVLDTMSNEMRVTVAQNLINALQGKSIAKNVMVLSKIVEHETT